MAADLLTTIRSELDVRLGELRPLLAEYERLVAAADALEQQHAAATRDESGQASSPPVSPSASASAAPRRRGRPRGSAAGAIKRAAAPVVSEKVAKPGRASVADSPEDAAGTRRERSPKGAARQAILAALEHGSHTVAELTMVTAMSGPNINGNVRRLLQERAIVKTSREGKTAYALVQDA